MSNGWLRPRRSRGLARCVLVILLVLAEFRGAPPRATLAAMPIDPIPDREVRRKDAPEVYLNDSFEAADAVSEAQQLVRRREYHAAARRLQDAMEAWGDRLIERAPGYYVSVGEHIQRMIAGWPPAGVRAYQELFERPCADALEAAAARRSLDALLEVFDRFFCTTGAAELGDIVGQLALEGGELALADAIYRRVLDEHPDAAVYRPRYQAMRQILAAIRDGTVEPTTDETGYVLRWMGEEQTLEQVVTHVRDLFSTSPLRSPPAGWPIFGGDNGRNRQPPTTVDELGLLWRHRFIDAPREAREPHDLFAAVSSGPSGAWRGLTAQPVVAEDRVYLQRYRELIALWRNTGAVAWRFAADDPAVSDPDAYDDVPAGWHAVTVHEGRVYAALPGDVVPFFGLHSVQSPPLLVCLDAATGEVIWPRDSDAFSEAHREIAFDTSPIVDGDRLYVVGRRRRSFGFEDCYLYRFDARTGRLVWRTHVGSASVASFGLAHSAAGVASSDDELVYVCTNLGSVAAIAARTGQVRWLRLYPRATGRRTGGDDGWGKGARAPWSLNPVLVDGERLVVLPAEARHVQVLDRADGRTLAGIPIEEVHQVQSLLGVRDDLLCGVGREAFCYDLLGHSRRWSAPLPEGSSLAGRAAWAGDRLLVPTERGLVLYSTSGEAPQELAWSSEAEPGNVLALADMVIVAGGQSLSAYVRKADIWSALRGRMAEAPTDPIPALELAEVALRGGDTTDALTVFEEAVSRVGRFAQPLDPSLQRRFFEDTLLFGETLARRGELAEATLDNLFLYASQCAPDANSHVIYRLAFARHFEQTAQPARAIRLYQQILLDQSLRAIPVPKLRRAETPVTRQVDVPGLGLAAETGDIEVADTLAQREIQRLLEVHGRELYAPFEVQARQWMAAALSARDVDQIRRVVESFPNSLTAPRALIEHGRLLVGEGRFLEAAARLTRAFQRYPESVDRAGLMLEIADGFERGGDPRRAYGWLTKGLREFPTSTLPLRGHETTFATQVARLREAGISTDPARPRLEPPLDGPQVTHLEGAALLVPWFQESPAADASRFFVRTDAGLMAYEARTGEPIWPQAVSVRAQPALLLASSAIALFASPFEVFALHVTSGQELWRYGEVPKEFDEGGGDWEDGKRFRNHALFGDSLISLRDDGRMTCVLLSTGEVRWSVLQRPVPSGPLAASDLGVVYAALQDGKVVVGMLEAASGAWVDAILTDKSQAVEKLLITLEGNILLATPRSVTAYHWATRQPVWRLDLEGRLRPGTLLLDVDALYVSGNGRDILKVSLEDGRVLWRSEPLTSRGSDQVSLFRQGSSLIFTSLSAIAAVDELTGLTLWVGTTPADARLMFHAVTDAYVLSVDVREGAEEEGSAATAYFYDHRHGSGVLARNGGIQDLGKVSPAAEFLALDGALLIRSGDVLERWPARSH